MTSVAEIMRQKLAAELAPAELDIVDESHRHVGHTGHDGRGESHFKLRIVSEKFAGLSRVERQRRVYAILAAELADRVHALGLATLTPAEADRQAAP